MLTSKDIKGWGSYAEFEGPLYWGKWKYTLPASPSDSDKVIATITATEGGAYDAVNCYDICIFTGGLIQWCERGQYSVSAMLGAVSEKEPELVQNCLRPAMQAAGVTFRRSDKGWRFYFNDGRLVMTEAEQRQQFFGSPTVGKKGTWQEANKELARNWTACFINIWQSEQARKGQVEFTARGLISNFVFGEARAQLFGGGSPQENTGLVGAVRAAYVSFAANNPAKTLAAYKTAQAAGLPMWSQQWAVEVLKQMTYAPKIAIYPERYNKIRPVLERLYGVDLPDMAEHLKGSGVSSEALMGAKEMQECLIKLGYNLGPAGADGIVGAKTRAALMEFQVRNAMPADGELSMATALKLREQTK